MSLRLRAPLVSLLVVCLLLTGCHPSQPLYFGRDDDLSFFLDKANDIAHPDIESAMLEEVTNAGEPITVGMPEFGDFWDLTLEDAVSMSLQNSKVIRGYGTPGLQSNIVAPGVDSLTSSPAGAGTLYDIAVRETEPGSLGIPGQPSTPGIVSSATQLETSQGTEGALAEFDAQVATSLFYNKTDRPRNTISTNPFTPQVFLQDDVQYKFEISKKAATGTQLFFRNATGYISNNIPSGFQPLKSAYTTAFEMEVQQPLLRGAGTMINRTPVVIARIGTDQQMAALESQLQNMVCNVEIRYWNLYAAYRTYEAAIAGRDSALATWRKTSLKMEEGNETAQGEAQAREQYYLFEGEVERSFASLVDAENNLRWLMGLTSTDSRLIRPVDEPIEAKMDFEWANIHNDSLFYRPLLRSERWEVKKRELQLAYARNSLLPRLNGVALYRWVGLGDNLISSKNSGIRFPGVGSSAWEGLVGGDYQEFQLGVEGGFNVGNRRELANVRNAQLELSREKSRLEDMELDISRELTLAYRALETNYQLAKTNFNRWAAAATEVKAVRELYRAGTKEGSLDTVLDAQKRQANAQVDYYQSLVEYNKSIALIHRRKGTSLQYCGVQFGEGPWPEKAYTDAVGHSRRRSASHKLDYGWTRPGVISRNSLNEGTIVDHAVEQVEEIHFNDAGGSVLEELQTPTPAMPEEVPMGGNLGPAPIPMNVDAVSNQPTATPPAAKATDVRLSAYVEEIIAPEESTRLPAMQTKVGSGVKNPLR